MLRGRMLSLFSYILNISAYRCLESAALHSAFHLALGKCKSLFKMIV